MIFECHLTSMNIMISSYHHTTTDR